MKAGVVALVGRPNTGKSTLLNNLLGQKVSITSPKPQTTRFPIRAVYEDERGQIIFVDTPGIFEKTKDILSKRLGKIPKKILKEEANLILYLVDHTRERDIEENRLLGIVRKVNLPKILAINKTDIKKPSYLAQYKFMEEEFVKTLEISAFYKQNLNLLLDAIFEYLPEGEPLVETKEMVTPLLNMDSRMFIGEIIREKAYLFLRDELPYKINVAVSEISERENGVLYIRAGIITQDERYRKMIIGKGGWMIKEIGMAARKELETAANKKVYLDLEVTVNPHWQEEL